MMMKYDIHCEVWPKIEYKGMSTGQMPVGIRAFDTISGKSRAVICYRHMHLNKAEAIRQLKIELEQDGN